MDKTDLSTLTACGECCTDCEKKLSGACPGCIEADGYVPEWSGSGCCRVHACAEDHGCRFCGLCPEFPCRDLTIIITWNPNIVDRLSALAKEYREDKTNAL